MIESAGELEQPKPMGIRCLEFLGFSDYVGREISVTIDGNQKQIRAEDFLEVCGKHATPAFIGLEGMDPHDPDYSEAYSGFRELAAYYLGANITEEA